MSDALAMCVAKREKRVVVQWPDGQMQIIARMDKQPPVIMDGPIAYNLVASCRSYYLYRPMPTE